MRLLLLVLLGFVGCSSPSMSGELVLPAEYAAAPAEEKPPVPKDKPLAADEKMVRLPQLGRVELTMGGHMLWCFQAEGKWVGIIHAPNCKKCFVSPAD